MLGRPAVVWRGSGPGRSRLPAAPRWRLPLYSYPAEGAVAYFLEDAPHAPLRHRLTSVRGCYTPPSNLKTVLGERSPFNTGKPLPGCQKFLRMGGARTRLSATASSNKRSGLWLLPILASGRIGDYERGQLLKS